MSCLSLFLSPALTPVYKIIQIACSKIIEVNVIFLFLLLYKNGGKHWQINIIDIIFMHDHKYYKMCMG